MTKKLLTEQDIGQFARIALCPKCASTKVKDAGVEAVCPARHCYYCESCDIEWCHVIFYKQTREGVWYGQSI